MRKGWRLNPDLVQRYEARHQMMAMRKLQRLQLEKMVFDIEACEFRHRLTTAEKTQ